MSTTMDRLLGLELPKPELRQKKIKRLSELAGEDVVFTLRELTSAQIEAAAGLLKDRDANYVLEGVQEPNLRDPRWYEDKMGCETPVDALKKLLRPGELRALARELDELAGYGPGVLEDISKN